MKKEYLKKSEYNFIAVDWSILAAGDFLTVASDGIPAAGAALAEFIEFLVLNTGTSLQDIHLIGFSGGVSHSFLKFIWLNKICNYKKKKL